MYFLNNPSLPAVCRFVLEPFDDAAIALMRSQSGPQRNVSIGAAFELVLNLKHIPSAQEAHPCPSFVATMLVMGGGVPLCVAMMWRGSMEFERKSHVCIAPFSVPQVMERSSLATMQFTALFAASFLI